MSLELGIQTSWDDIFRKLAEGTEIAATVLDDAIDMAEAVNIQLEEFVNSSSVNYLNENGDVTISGLLLAGNGTAALPSYSFGSDPDTGMYRDGINSIGWATNGTERMQLGTTNLNFNADVTGSASILVFGVGTAASPCYTFSGDSGLGMYRDGSNSLAFATNGIERMQLANTNLNFGAAATGRPAIRHTAATVLLPSYTFAGDTNTGMYRHAADGISFTLGGVAALKLNSTTDIELPLSATLISFTGVAGPCGIAFSPSGTMESQLVYRSGSNQWVFEDSLDADLMTVDADTGNVTIPSGTLTVADTLVSNGNLDVNSTSTFSGDAAFDTDTLFVDVSADRVGINDSTPSFSLDVKGTGRSTGTWRCDGIFDAIGVYNSTTGSAANVYVATNGVVSRSTSSGKYKRDITTMASVDAHKILDMRPVKFRNLAGTGVQENWTHYGLIAEEVAAIDPRLVHWGPALDNTELKDERGHLIAGEYPLESLTEPEGVQYDRIVPHIITLLQEQAAQIEELQRLVAASGSLPA